MKESLKAVLALGGNAISPKGEVDTIANQFSHTRNSLFATKYLIDQGYDLVITHGNGPQVGNALLRTELTADQVPILPLGYCVANVAGGMGYMIQQSLQNMLKKEKIHKDVVTLMTQVVVEKNDPEISNPTKFIGQRYNQEDAKRLSKQFDWTIKKTSDGDYRRIVPSPKPISIIESESITKLVNEGKIVITLGGGGIPVYVMENGDLEGCDAVIDKDLASSILAQEIGARYLLIITDVENVYINFGQKDQKPIYRITSSEIGKYKKEGHFAKGTMRPKINAGLNFISNGGESVLITSIENIQNALKGKAGTIITNNK